MYFYYYYENCNIQELLSKTTKKKKKKLISVEFRRISNKLLIMYRTYSINIRVCLEITRAREIFNFDPLT